MTANGIATDAARCSYAISAIRASPRPDRTFVSRDAGSHDVAMRLSRITTSQPTIAMPGGGGGRQASAT